MQPGSLPHRNTALFAELLAVASLPISPRALSLHKCSAAAYAQNHQLFGPLAASVFLTEPDSDMPDVRSALHAAQEQGASARLLEAAHLLLQGAPTLARGRLEAFLTDSWGQTSGETKAEGIALMAEVLTILEGPGRGLRVVEMAEVRGAEERTASNRAGKSMCSFADAHTTDVVECLPPESNSLS